MTPNPRPELTAIPAAVHGGTRSGADLPDVAGVPRIDFSSSVNAYGSSAEVQQSLLESVAAGCPSAYPDPTCTAARTAIATRDDLRPTQLMLGAGATELLLSVVLAFVRPGDQVLLPSHAFGEYERAARICGARAITVSGPGSASPPELTQCVAQAASDYAAAVLHHAPRIAFLCAPESPSGRIWPTVALREVARACRRTGTLLVLDQSFDAFAAEPLGTPALRDDPCTLHVRSLTKDHALAGIRLGYLAGPEVLVEAVHRASMPWTVSSPAQAAAVAACEAGSTEHVRRTTALLRESAKSMRDRLQKLGMSALPSDVHYFLLDVGDAAGMARYLTEWHAITVRDCTSFGLPAHVRVAVRTPADNELLIAALGALGSARGETSAPFQYSW